MWFGVIFTMNMEMANITPPLGYNLFVMKGIVPPDVSMGDIIRGIVPFLILFGFAMALVMAFPNLALWLPSTMVKR
ncbi:TRAP transporter large permease subunit [Chloroflexota bacterium]